TISVSASVKDNTSQQVHSGYSDQVRLIVLKAQGNMQAIQGTAGLGTSGSGAPRLISEKNVKYVDNGDGTYSPANDSPTGIDIVATTDPDSVKGSGTFFIVQTTISTNIF